MSSTRERLFNAPLRTLPVTLSTGDVVEVRPLSVIERTRLVKGCTVDGDVDNELLIPALVIACTYDPTTGDKVFTVGDRETLDALPASAIDPLWNAAAKLNGFAEDAVAVAEKN